jgi:signal transduction histidine kinase
MSREQIELRIRSLFIFLFGVIFVFLFILTSSFLKLQDQSSSIHKDQVTKFLVDGLSMREKYLFEEFMTKNYYALAMRLNNLLTDFKINKHEVVIFEAGNCMIGSINSCQKIAQLKNSLSENKVTSKEFLGKLFVLFPVVAWGERVGEVAIVIPLEEISVTRNFFEQFCYYILPFIFLVFITFFLYRFIESNLIKPTITKIIESEKNEAQKLLMRQFAHDIQSPISAIEVAIEHTKDLPFESRELLSVALSRITSISKDLLEKEQSKNRTCSLSVKSLVDQIIREKSLEYSSLNIIFSFIPEENLGEVFVSNHNLYRVLSNLINNSIEASKDNSVIEINILAFYRNKSLQLSVKDNGKGVEGKNIPSILRGEFSSKINGFGLGISGAKKWIDKNNGVLQMSSVLNKGTTIDLMLPVNDNLICDL